MSREQHEHSAGSVKPGRYPGVGATPLAELFPDADYRHQMRFQRGLVSEFFQPWNLPLDLLEQRRSWLQRDTGSHAAALPESTPLMDEMIDEMKEWALDGSVSGWKMPTDPNRLIISLGGFLEPDFLLLKPDAEGGIRLCAGCVCFPSSWSLEEKIGRPLDWIHQVVPGLNQHLGQPIDTFLRRMAPGISWLRANWGLSRSPELNQHPNRRLPRLEASVRPDEVWLRVEHQALVALPKSGGILFGIRVVVHSLEEIQRAPAAVTGLRRALETMPEDMAVYKGIAPARASLIRMLSDSTPSGD